MKVSVITVYGSNIYNRTVIVDEHGRVTPLVGVSEFDAATVLKAVGFVIENMSRMSKTEFNKKFPNDKIQNDW